MRPEVRAKLLQIAEDFKQSLGLTDLNVKDITLSGSNAGYTYTPHSDIDLHLVVDLPKADASDVYRELFDAKKFQYNETHNIKIGGYDVELYVENADKTAVSQGIFSVINDDWIKIPLKKRSTINDNVVKNKYDVIKNHIESAIESADLERLTNTAAKIKKMRQSGLDQNGELGPENLAYKMLRSQGVIKKLYDARTAAKDHELSLRERTIQVKKPFKYGFRVAEDVSSNPSGVSPETKMFLSEKPALSQQEIVTDFVNHCVEQLGIEQLPTIKFKRDPEWSARNKTFGRYNHKTNLLEVSLAGRHVMDILRTVAHELTHQRQHEVGNVPGHAGETGSEWENEANAKAGVLMREYAQQHPEFFADESLEESSGYIPTKKQANDPRFKMALTKDIRPGATGREANKMALNTDSQGRPALLMKTANQMHEDLANEFRWELALMETEILGEINMSTGSLRQEAAKTGAIAGMEFEMIVPNTENDDGDLEPDYDQDERCRSIDDAVQFFYDGEYNSRNEIDRLRAKMSNDYQEWLDDKLYQDWERSGEEYLQEWVPNNVDESEWNPEDLEGEARQEALEEYISNLHNDPGSSDAFDEFREENQDSYDESDWLDDEDLDRMTGVENAYDISWPHWTSVGGGEASIEDVAQEFENAIGRDTKASGNYHSGRVPRPGPDALHYIVEPDGSLEADDSGDTGLEFVSPPLPIDEILSDLNKVKAWAKEYGCYTNDSTGLHINISVPGYSRENLDFVKLALLMGDKYVLDLFGRAGNTYAKSALDMVKGKVRNDPESAQQLLEKMKGNLDSLASKAIHSGVTSKYTSINTKDGHIEFRSPGGDWLDENFEQIENTLLRFTVAMSAALNPDAYREEYLKKLYKLLTEDNKDDSDTIRYFSEYVAGKIPKAALRSFVKQAQLTRQVRRGTTGDKKMWWRVGRPGYGASAEVVATTKDEAIALGKKEYPDWASAKDMTATPLRPYEEANPTPEEGNWGIWIRANDRFANQPGSYSRSETPPLMRFPSRAAAELWVEQQRTTRPNMRTDIEVREIEPAVQNTGSATSGNWGVWVPSLDRWATIGNAGPRRFTDRAGADAWIQDYNARNSGSELELTAREIEPGAAGADTNVNYEIYNRETGEVVDTTQLRNDNEAQIRLDDYRAHGPHRLNTQDATRTFGIRRGPGVTNTQTDTNPLRPTGPGPWEVASRSNNQVYFNPPSTYRRNAESEARTWLSQNGHNPNEFEVRTRQGAGNADAAQGGIIDIEPDISQYTAPQTLTRPGQGQQTFTGEWQVLDPEDREIYRFSGVGNNQSDANRVAMNWLRQNPGRMQAGVTVVPVMSEDDLEEGWRSTLAGAAAAGAMAFTPAPTNNTAPAAGPAVQPAAVQQSPTAAAESALSKIAQAAGIKGVELAQFLAQCAHETGNFLHLEELGGNRYLAQYDPTVNPAKAKALGNTKAGDGAKYKGRGFIQITGKANYAKAGQALGIDLVNNPELAASPDVAAKVAVWYWQSRVQPRVQDFSDTRGVTKQINPGLKGLADRQSNFKDYQQQIAAVAQPKATG
jgi:putative chitinase